MVAEIFAAECLLQPLAHFLARDRLEIGRRQDGVDQLRIPPQLLVGDYSHVRRNIKREKKRSLHVRGVVIASATGATKWEVVAAAAATAAATATRGGEEGGTVGWSVGQAMVARVLSLATVFQCDVERRVNGCRGGEEARRREMCRRGCTKAENEEEKVVEGKVMFAATFSGACMRSLCSCMCSRVQQREVVGVAKRLRAWWIAKRAFSR